MIRKEKYERLIKKIEKNDYEMRKQEQQLKKGLRKIKTKEIDIICESVKVREE